MIFMRLKEQYWNTNFGKYVFIDFGKQKIVCIWSKYWVHHENRGKTPTSFSTVNISTQYSRWVCVAQHIRCMSTPGKNFNDFFLHNLYQQMNAQCIFHFVFFSSAKIFRIKYEIKNRPGYDSVWLRCIVPPGYDSVGLRCIVPPGCLIQPIIWHGSFVDIDFNFNWGI